MSQMMKHVSTCGTEQEKQAQFEKIHRWLCNAGGITDDAIRGWLEYQAQTVFHAREWDRAASKEARERMLVAMWISTYEARCQQYVITIDRVTAAANFVQHVPRMPPTVPGRGLEHLESLKECREVLKARLEQHRWRLNTKKRAKVRLEWNILKSPLLQQSYIFLEVCPERKNQLSSDMDGTAFSINQVLASKDAHRAIFPRMEQVGMEMTALVALHPRRH